MRQKPLPWSQGYTLSCLELLYAMHLLVYFNLNPMTSCNLFLYIPNFYLSGQVQMLSIYGTCFHILYFESDC